MKERQTAIPCSIIRGGTSRGLYFRAGDLPDEPELRNRILLAIVGGPDALQVDGIGGGHPLTNKVAVIAPAGGADADVDYLFLQVSAGEGRVSDAQNCGNILAGVGPYAIEQGMVEPVHPQTTLRVRMLNSGNLCELVVQTPQGLVEYAGTTAIDGVPGTAAPVLCNYLDVAGSATGALLPTGKVSERVDGIDVTCIDNGMPVVLLRATDLDVSGKEAPAELETNDVLTGRLESIRLALGPRMRLADVIAKSVPKMCLVSPPERGGIIATRTFIPHACHRSIGVLGAVSVATACLLEGSVAAGLAIVPDGTDITARVEHPSGALPVCLELNAGAPPEEYIRRAGVVRSARTLMRGDAFAPAGIPG